MAVLAEGKVGAAVFWFAWLSTLFLLSPDSFGLLRRANGEELPAAILVSLRIRPYLEALEGVTETLSRVDRSYETFFLEEGNRRFSEKMSERIAEKRFSACFAIGPEAGRLLSGLSPPHPPLFYTMILNPQSIFSEDGPPCGVSLQIPAVVQLQEIASALPTVEQVGLLYNPRENEAFLETAVSAARPMELRVRPLAIRERSQIPAVLAEGLESVDAVWFIPDRTVISESVIQFIIKEALLRGVPAIGYNRFFYESGAVLSFVIDYRAVGSQAGRMFLELKEPGACGNVIPHHEVWLNPRALDRVGIPAARPENGRFRMGP